MPQKTTTERFIENHNERLSIILGLGTLVVFFFLLIQTIPFPGFSFCEDDGDCPALKPLFHTYVVIAGCVLYFFLTCLSFTLIFAPGFLMDFPLRTKTIALVALVLIPMSLTHAIPSVFFYRYNVFPFYSISPYEFTIQPINETAGTIVVQDLHSAYRSIWKEGYVFVEVTHVDENTQSPRDKTPGSTVVFRDSTVGDATLLEEDVVITRNISGLENNQWYLFEIIPARDYSSSNNDETVRMKWFPYVFTKDVEGYREDGVYVDLRVFKLCRWEADTGCSLSHAKH